MGASRASESKLPYCEMALEQKVNILQSIETISSSHPEWASGFLEPDRILNSSMVSLNFHEQNIRAFYEKLRLGIGEKDWDDLKKHLENLKIRKGSNVASVNTVLLLNRKTHEFQGCAGCRHLPNYYFRELALSPHSKSFAVSSWNSLDFAHAYQITKYSLENETGFDEKGESISFSPAYSSIVIDSDGHFLTYTKRLFRIQLTKMNGLGEKIVNQGFWSLQRPDLLSQGSSFYNKELETFLHLDYSGKSIELYSRKPSGKFKKTRQDIYKGGFFSDSGGSWFSTLYHDRQVHYSEDLNAVFIYWQNSIYYKYLGNSRYSGSTLYRMEGVPPENVNAVTVITESKKAQKIVLISEDSQNNIEIRIWNMNAQSGEIINEDPLVTLIPKKAQTLSIKIVGTSLFLLEGYPNGSIFSLRKFDLNSENITSSERSSFLKLKNAHYYENKFWVTPDQEKVFLLIREPNSNLGFMVFDSTQGKN